MSTPVQRQQFVISGAALIVHFGPGAVTLHIVLKSCCRSEFSRFLKHSKISVNNRMEVLAGWMNCRPAVICWATMSTDIRSHRHIVRVVFIRIFMRLLQNCHRYTFVLYMALEVCLTFKKMSETAVYV